MLNKSQKVKFSIIQVTYWCSYASFSSFAIAFVRTKGLSASYIGVMGAVFMLCAVLGQFFWGSICDRFQSNKTVFLLTNSLLVVASLLFYLTSSPFFILITYAFIGFLQSPTASNMDTWILKNADYDFTKYGPIRSMGSLGFALFIFFYGTLVSSKGYWIMPIFLAAFTVITVTIALTIPENKIDPDMLLQTKIKVSDMKTLFSIKPFVFLLVILFFAGFSSISIMQNKILIWEYFHAPISYQGYDSSINALFQVPFLFLASVLAKISVRFRLTLGLFFMFLMLIIVYFAPIPQIVVVGSMINGIGYGFLLPSMREIIATSAPMKLSTTAQGLGDAVYTSLSGITGSLLAGYMIDTFDIKTMILVNVVVYIIPLGLSVLTFIQKRSRI